MPISIRRFTILGQQLVDISGAKKNHHMMITLEKSLNSQADITTISLSKLDNHNKS